MACLPAECTEDGCIDPVLARGWCNRHYLRWYRHGILELDEEHDRRRKLTREDVLEMRRLYATAALNYKELANRFNVTKQNVIRIIHRKNWAHI
jgi:hypothetical protein